MASNIRDISRFSQSYLPEPNTGCWLWEKYTDSSGYGRISIGDKQQAAHRFSWQIYRGKIPKRMLVCHRCDTPACVNPAHLFLGTKSDNANDAAQKGRLGTPKRLTEEKVKEIKRLLETGGSQRKIAKQFGVSSVTINAIHNGRIWRS